MSPHRTRHSHILSTVVIGFFALMILFVFLSSSKALPPLSEYINMNASSTTEVSAPLGKIIAEIANNSALREKGLSDRASMEADHGMLFVFPKPGIYGFWMKDMNFPLDMVWVDQDHKVIGVDTDLSPATYPESFFPPGDATYVIELNAGGAERFGIKFGTVLGFSE